MKLYLTLLFLLSGFFLKAQNYDETKVGTYTLPAVLKTQKGTRIESATQWEALRRTEVLQLFEQHVYGRMPKEYDRIEFITTQQQKGVMNGKADLKEVTITVYKDEAHVNIRLVQFTPAQSSKPVPTFLLINNRSVRNTAPTRDTLSGFWPAEQVIENGFGIAAFQVDDAAPDHKDRYTKGVLTLYPEEQKRPDGMKAIGAWAWAASRVMDFFETESAINAEQVIVVGHSRGGKASLWTAAQDQRFAMCITNNSGNTGAALSKRNFGETVAIINKAFPHWFANNYNKYSNKESLLPVDQHMLLALVAPRPLYVTSASEDLWADPTGTYMALQEAEPVYKLYLGNNYLTPRPPALNTPLHTPAIGYHIREGKHNMDYYDWEQFVQYAKRHFK